MLHGSKDRNGRRGAAFIMLFATAHLVVADAARGMVSDDYPGMSIPGRPSVALVRAPGGIYVNTWNANLNLPREDLYFVSPGIPLDFTSSYNSFHNLEAGPFGFGWSFSYGVSVTQLGTDARLDWGDGRRDRYTFSGTFDADNEAAHADLTSIGPGQFEACTRQQICYRFDDPSHGKLTSVRDPSGNTVTLAYDPGNRLVSVSDTNGLALVMHYDALDRIVSVIDTASSPSRNVQYAYDSRGNLSQVVDATGNVTTYEYDCPHLLTRITDVRGNSTEIDYNSAGQVVRVEDANQRSLFIYDPFHRASARIARVDPGTDLVTTYEYDSINRLTREIDPRGGVEETTYDGNGHISSITSPDNRTVTLLYDADGNLLSHTNDPGETRSFTYDPVFNKPLTYTDPLLHGLTLGYDAAGRVTSLEDDAGNQESWAYDVFGRTTSYSNARGDVTTYEYDSLSRLTRQIDPTLPLGLSTEYEYDSINRLTRIITPLNDSSALEYDAHDRLTAYRNPLGGEYKFEYDGLDNVTLFVDPDVRTHRFHYDESQRLTLYEDPLNLPTQYEYDNLSRLTRVVDPGSQDTTFTYDGAGNQLTRADDLGNTTTFAYDLDGNRTTRLDANGTLTAFAYDGANRITAVDYPGVLDDISYQYDSDGKVTRAVNGQADWTLAYDSLDRLSFLSDSFTLRSVTYGYDADSNRTSVTDPGSDVTTYEYDSINRVTRIIDPNLGTTDYSYDPNGRLAGVVQPNGVTSTYEHDGADRLTLATGADAASYTNDANGNRTSKVVGPDTTLYEYSTENQLTRVTLPGGAAIDYAYDGFDRLARKSGPGASLLEWVRDPTAADNVLTEYDLSGTRIARHTYAQRAESYNSYEDISSTQYLHGDRLRTTRAATDAAAATSATFAYDPFGEPAGASGFVGDRGFSGAQADPDTGLLYLRSRWYDPATGRFLSPDRLFGTLNDPPNFNRYTYTGNNPQTYTDPYGEWFLAVVAVVAVVALVVAVVKTVKSLADGMDEAQKANKKREQMFDAISQGNSKKAEQLKTEFTDGLNRTLDHARDAASSAPGTSLTGPVSIPTNKAEAVTTVITEGLKQLNDATTPDPEERKPVTIPQGKASDNGNRAEDKRIGPVSYNMRGANSRDGVESNTLFAEGAQTAALCGVPLGGFPGPGSGQIFGVDVDPADGTVYQVGIGGAGGIDIYQTERNGFVLNSNSVPFLNGGQGITVAGQNVMVTHPGAPPGPASLLLSKDFTTPRGLWIFDGPNNPNPTDAIPGVVDLELLGPAPTPSQTALAIVASNVQPDLFVVELQLNQPPGLSSDWAVLQTIANPTGGPITGLGLGAQGLVASSAGDNHLIELSTLQVIDVCPAANPAAFGVGVDPDGTIWNTTPPFDSVDNLGGPGGVPLGDGDMDGVPDDCDDCPGTAGPQADSDGDSFGDVCDCEPFNPLVNPAALEECTDSIDNDCDGLTDGASPFCMIVAEVDNLILSKSVPQFSWDPVPGATGYDLIRGEVNQLAIVGPDVDLGALSCLDVDSADLVTEQDPLSPPVGRAFFYLVRVHHGIAPYGNSTAGQARVPGPGDCPTAP